MKIHCDVILDLLPLAKDGVASEESKRLVQEHLINCQSCKKEYETFEIIKEELVPIKDEKIIASIKRRIYITQLLLLIAGGIIGVALTNSMAMFYNLIIMPVIGGVAFVFLKGKWYMAPLAIFILTYLWEIFSIIPHGFDWHILYTGLFISLIYSALVGLGVIITRLLKFAFSKEG